MEPPAREIQLVWQNSAPIQIRTLVEGCVREHAALLPSKVTQIALRLDVFPGVRLPGPPSPPAFFSSLEAPHEITLTDDGTHFPLEVIRRSVVRVMVEIGLQEAFDGLGHTIKSLLQGVPVSASYPLPKNGIDGVAAIIDQYAYDCLRETIDVVAEEIAMIRGEVRHVPFWERPGVPPATAMVAMFKYGFDPVREGPPEFREWVADQGGKEGFKL